MKRQKGITLIEVLIFIAIVAIVVSVTRGAIANYKAEHARDSAPRIEFRAVK
jgi:prepilin-type N-terminal cleavage/methylation domain-containing protein